MFAAYVCMYVLLMFTILGWQINYELIKLDSDH